MRFRDRPDAGRALARHLRGVDLPDPVAVVGLPRGGVPVAAEIARDLGAPLDVAIVRKLGVPWQPELGMGAIGEGGVIWIDQRMITRLRISDRALAEVLRRETDELERRVATYRAGGAPVNVRGATVVLVDDGIATGGTLEAAVRIMRERGAGKVLIAAPVAPPEAVDALRRVADGVEVPVISPDFRAIGRFYDDFTQTADEEVLALLH